MFEIDEEFYEAFAGISKERYIKKKSAEFTEAHPEQASCAGADNVERFMRMAWEKAEKYNMSTDQEFNILTALMQNWGCDFDVDPQYPWARFKRFPDVEPIARSKESEALACLKTVYAKFYDCFKATVGEDFSHIIAAYDRIRKIQFRELVEIRDSNDISIKIYNLYPQRYAYISQKTIESSVLPEAGDKAYRYGLDPRVGTALCAGLIFTCGISFDTDPLYHAVNKDLGSPTLPGMQKEQFLLGHLKALVSANLRALTRQGGSSHDA